MSDRPVTSASVKMVVRITSREEGHLIGTLDSIYFKEPYAFSGEVEMLKTMETTFDLLGFPDKNLLPRTFGKAKERMRQHESSLEQVLAARRSGETPIMPADTIATYEISVAFRRNAEWQGTVHWVDKGETCDFRSIVELVKFIDAS